MSSLSPNHTRSIEEIGRELWAELHAVEQPTIQWYNAWRLKIPHYGCDCALSWWEITERMPPDFSSVEAFHRWAIDAHNEVNKKLGKPIFHRG